MSQNKQEALGSVQTDLLTGRLHCVFIDGETCRGTMQLMITEITEKLPFGQSLISLSLVLKSWALLRTAFSAVHRHTALKDTGTAVIYPFNKRSE